MPDLSPLTPALQQKAQQLREQALQTQAPWLDGSDLVHLIDGLLELLNGPAPDLNQVSEQLTGLAETLQGALPNLNEAGELIQPLLETIGDLLGSLGDLSS